MNYKKFIKKILLCTLFCIIFFTELQASQCVYAASMKFYNQTTGTTETYKGKQVIYTYNGRTLSLTYPGIIVSGTALADCTELFAEELGLKVSIDGEKITITDGASVMKLTLGSNKATFNGESRTTNVVPRKLKFDDAVKYYVPSRFVAEAFGFHYVWVDSISTVKITKTLDLTIENNKVAYNGSFYSVNFEEKAVSSILPLVYYDATIYAPAQAIFEAAGCHYEEDGSTIMITNDELSLKLELNNKNAYLNGMKKIIGVAPVQITDNTTGISMKYIPFEFAADMLGFTYTYDEAEHCFTLLETEHTGKAEEIISTEIIESIPNTIDTQNRTYFFEWTEEDSNVEENAEDNHLSKVSYYALENKVEVLELYGINASSVNAFRDNSWLIMELSGITTNLVDQFYPSYDSSYLFYTLLTVLSSDNTKLYIIPFREIEWQMVETEDCVQLYIYSPEIFTKGEIASANVSTFAYPDDKLILPLPQAITKAEIQDQDNYLEKNFQIKITGNYVDFYQENLIQNPFYQVKEYDVTYNSVTDITELTFYTRTICAYRYEIQDGYLALTVGRPKDLYSKIVVLDAGHGGEDPGASKKGYKEKDLNFTILNNYTKELFNDSDIKVYFTRETDVLIDLYDRAAFASELGADLFLSLHMNANNSSSVNGTEIFYSSYNNAVTANGLYSARLGKTLAENISSMMGTKNRGVTNSEFVVVKYNTVPAVLIELGFMTNSKELAKLTDTEYQKKAAIAIYLSVFEIFELFPTGR